MRATTVLSACATFALLACAAENGPTEPEARGAMVPAAAGSPAVVDIWRERAHNLGGLRGTAVGVLPNSAGQTVVYTFGGCDELQGNGSQCTLDVIGIYNPVTEARTSEHVIGIGRYSTNGVGAIGGKLYVSGGFNSRNEDEDASNLAYSYDPVTHLVTSIADIPKSSAEGVTGVFDGKLYVLPGMCNATLIRPDRCVEEPIKRLYRYNPVTNKWAARKAAPHFHRLGAGGFIGGKFYVVGGFNRFQPVADLDVYDPATDTWTTRAPLPTAGRVIGATLQSKLYVVAETTAYVYDPATNKWTSIAAPAKNHDGVVRIVINGKLKLLAAGGVSFDAPNNTEVYTP